MAGMRLRLVPTAIAAVAAVSLAGCVATPRTEPTSAAPSAPATSATGGVQPAGDVSVIAAGLTSPWSVLRIPLGGVGEAITLVSERDTGAVVRILPDGSLAPIGTIPGVVPRGEGGLLGLAYLDDGVSQYLYAYFTSADDNRIVRIPFGDELGIGAQPEIVLDGLSRAATHNGGRIAFGPDGMLYAGVGDAGERQVAQDPSALNGKILRMTPTGGVPADNPTAGSLVYSMGHRNVQGLAWDADGVLWASEFGQNTWDELNRIEAGGNYGWPVVEGQVADARFIAPVLQWSTDDASPSGLAFVDGTFFMAALRGQRVWAIDIADDGTASSTAWFVDEFGRIRDVASGPGGTLWFLTSNTDGRGAPGPDDDRLLQVRLQPPSEG